MKLEKKQKIVESLHDSFKRTKIVILTDYKGLNVAAVNELRRKLRDSGTEYRVVKNTLIRRAAKETHAELINAQYTGPNALALNYDDPVAPAKVLTIFAKDHPAFEIKAAVLDRKVLGPDAIDALSKLPAREVLLAQVLSAMNGVPTSIVRVLNAVPNSIVNVIQAIKDKKAEMSA